MTKGSAVFWRMTGGSRTAPAEENVVGHGVHPHPPSSRGQGSNLPPSSGEGISRRGTVGYFHSNDMFYEGGWVTAFEGKTGGGMGDRGGRSFEVRKRGWVPASARTTGGGTVNLPRLHGGRLCAGKRVWVGLDSGFRRNDERGRLIFPVFWRMTGGSRTAPTEENVVGHEVHPHPNLPPSRGKGFVATERAIFIVMTCFTKGDGFPPSREKREVGGDGRP